MATVLPPARRWWARAFGVTFSGDFDAPVLEPLSFEPDASAPGDQVALRLIAPDEFSAIWGGADAELLVLFNGPDAKPLLKAERSTLGYRLWRRGAGSHLISADGATALCAPGRAPT